MTQDGSATTSTDARARMVERQLRRRGIDDERVLAAMGEVTSERFVRLATEAAATLAELGYDNVEVRVGDGAQGAADRAPFGGISVTATAQDELPRALVEQLAPGAALVC